MQIVTRKALLVIRTAPTNTISIPDHLNTRSYHYHKITFYFWLYYNFAFPFSIEVHVVYARVLSYF